MKRLFIAILCAISSCCPAQTDSTYISIESVANRDLRIISDLNQIQFLKIICSDSQMIGRRFFLSIDEYKYGSLTSSDSLGLKCEDRKFPVTIGSDTMYYFHNLCKGISYNEACIKDNFHIELAGKLERDTFHLRIYYPGIHLSVNLNGSSSYLLREINRNSNDPLSIRLKEKIAIMSYSPPFETGGGLNSYCLITSEPYTRWYEVFD